jgi:hypothetical protein
MDWMPASRDDQIAMCRNWISYLTSERRTAWNIPTPDFTELGLLFDAARTILQKAKDDTQRTPVVTVQCGEAFKALLEKMRYFKKHFFLVPPLDNADIIALGLSIPEEKSDIPPPESEPEADFGFPDYHLIDVLRIRRRGPLKGDARSEWGVRIHIGILDGTKPWHIAAPPVVGSDLAWSLFTRRRRERFNFEGNSGKTIYMALHYENGKGKAGPFGPISSAVIP